MKETVIHKPAAGMITNKEFCTESLKACKYFTL